jgi:hypothetical protein
MKVRAPAEDTWFDPRTGETVDPPARVRSRKIVIDLDRLAEISKRQHEDSSNDSANANELYEVLEMLGFDPEHGK